MLAKAAIHFNIGNLQIATALVCKPCYQEINSLPLGQFYLSLQRLNLRTKSCGATIQKNSLLQNFCVEKFIFYGISFQKGFWLLLGLER